MKKLSVKEQQLKLREELILEAVNGLLAEKGFDLMTVDEVAATVGIAKPSLYKHFDSKEALAAAAMVRLLEHTRAMAESLPPDLREIDKLRAVLRWALQQHAAKSMPLLPSTRSTLRDALMKNKAYVSLLMRVSDLLGGWIQGAQKRGDLDPKLPPDVVLYTLFARSCDPVLEYLQASGAYDDQQIVELMLKTTFDGLGPATAARKRS